MCIVCPTRCGNYGCYSRIGSQGRQEQLCCDSNCLGGCNGPSATECIACQNVFYQGRCQRSCPYGTYEVGLDTIQCNTICLWLGYFWLGWVMMVLQDLLIVHKEHPPVNWSQRPGNITSLRHWDMEVHYFQLKSHFFFGHCWG